MFSVLSLHTSSQSVTQAVSLTHLLAITLPSIGYLPQRGRGENEEESKIYPDIPTTGLVNTLKYHHSRIEHTIISGILQYPITGVVLACIGAARVKEEETTRQAGDLSDCSFSDLAEYHIIPLRRFYHLDTFSLSLPTHYTVGCEDLKIILPPPRLETQIGIVETYRRQEHTSFRKAIEDRQEQQ